MFGDTSSTTGDTPFELTNNNPSFHSNSSSNLSTDRWSSHHSSAGLASVALEASMAQEGTLQPPPNPRITRAPTRDLTKLNSQLHPQNLERWALSTLDPSFNRERAGQVYEYRYVLERRPSSRCILASNIDDTNHRVPRPSIPTRIIIVIVMALFAPSPVVATNDHQAAWTASRHELVPSAPSTRRCFDTRPCRRSRSRRTRRSNPSPTTQRPRRARSSSTPARPSLSTTSRSLLLDAPTRSAPMADTSS